MGASAQKVRDSLILAQGMVRGLEDGLLAIDALGVLATGGNKLAHEMVQAMVEGGSFDEVCARSIHLWSPIDSLILVSGEQSGRLHHAWTKILGHWHSKLEGRKRFLAQIFQPAVVLVSMVAAALVQLVVIDPMVGQLSAVSGIDGGGTGSLVSLVVCAAVPALALGLWLWHRRPLNSVTSIRYHLETLCGSMALLSSTGLSSHRSVALLLEMPGLRWPPPVYRSLVDLGRALGEGRSLVDAMGSSDLWPRSMVAQMETPGWSCFDQQRWERAQQWLTRRREAAQELRSRLLPPAITIGSGALVALFAFSMVEPLMGLYGGM